MAEVSREKLFFPRWWLTYAKGLEKKRKATNVFVCVLVRGQKGWLPGGKVSLKENSMPLIKKIMAFGSA